MGEGKLMYRNVRRSKQLIQDALLRLLVQKEIEKIKVKELIEAADISKGTFYAHYTCLQDILLEIEDEQLAIMFRVLNEHPSALLLESFFPLFLCGLQEMEKKQELFRVLFCVNCGSSFSRRVSMTFLDLLLSYTIDSTYFENAHQAKAYLTFVAGGAIAVIQDWLTNTPDIPAEEVAKLLSDCALSGIRGFREASREA